MNLHTGEPRRWLDQPPCPNAQIISNWLLGIWGAITLTWTKTSEDVPRTPLVDSHSAEIAAQTGTVVRLLVLPALITIFQGIFQGSGAAGANSRTELIIPALLKPMRKEQLHPRINRGGRGDSFRLF